MPILSLSKFDNFQSCIFSNSNISKVVFFQSGKFIELLISLAGLARETIVIDAAALYRDKTILAEGSSC